MPTDDFFPLFSWGWGDPEQQAIGKPLEEVADIRNRMRDKIDEWLQDRTKAIISIAAQLEGKTTKEIQYCLEECHVCLNAIQKRVWNSIDDKLTAVRFCLDRVCAKCGPEGQAIARIRPPAATGPGQPGTIGVVSTPGGALPPGPRGTEPTQDAQSGSPAWPGVQQPVAGDPSAGFLGGAAGGLLGGFADDPQVRPVNQIKPPQFGGGPLPGIAFGGPAPVPPGGVGGGRWCVWKDRIWGTCHVYDGNTPAALLNVQNDLIACGNDYAQIYAIAAQCNGTAVGLPGAPPGVPVSPPAAGQPPQCVVCQQTQPTPTPCPSCPKPEYCAWRKADGSSCYMLAKDKPPLDPSDVKIGCSDDPTALASKMMSACSSSTPTQPVPPGPTTAVGANKSLCGPLAYLPQNLGSGFLANQVVLPILQLLIGDQATVDAAISAAKKDLLTVDPGKFLWAALRLAGLELFQRFDKTFTDSLKRSGCVDAKFIDAAGGLAIWQFLEQWIIGPFPWVSTPLKYAANTMCPVTFPSADQASLAWLRGFIDDQTYAQWVKQNNFCFDPWHLVTLANQARLSPFESVTALRRGLINEDTYKAIIRANGFLGTRDGEVIKGITLPIPTMSDLVSFMVRDVEDPNIVNRFRLDDEFTNKWQGQIQTWGYQQGITDEIALRYWRAHWLIPAPTQLFQMFHRSRVMKPGDKGYISYDDVRAALIQQDIAPFWIDPLLNTTYSLLRLVDIRRAYEIGVLDRDGIIQQYVQRGYSEANANTLADYNEKEKQRKLLSDDAVKRYAKGQLPVLGMISRLRSKGATDETIQRAIDDSQPKLLDSKPVRQFEQWILNEQELKDRLNNLGAQPTTTSEAIFIGRRKRFRTHRTRCLAAIRKRFLIGELDASEVNTTLITQGASAEEAKELVALWQCEAAARGREFTAQQLCALFMDGIIDAAEFLRRLKRLGWDDDSAYAIMAQCGIKLSLKVSRELDKMVKERERLAEKARKAQEREAKALARQASQAQSRLDALAKARDQREQRLRDAATRLAQHTGLTYKDTGPFVRSMWEELLRNYQLTPNEVTQVILMAIDRDKPTSLAEAESAIIDLADVAEQFGAFDERVTPATNGDNSGQLGG